VRGEVGLVVRGVDVGGQRRVRGRGGRHGSGQGPEHGGGDGQTGSGAMAESHEVSHLLCGDRSMTAGRAGRPATELRYAKMSILGTFHPATLTTAVAPCRSAEFQVTVSVWDSPGNSVMSLFCQIEDCSSLSPASSWPLAVPRRMSARSRKATVEPEVLVIVTVVARSAPSGPARLTVPEVAVTDEAGSVCSPVRFAYWLRVPCGWPRVLLQFTTSAWVDSQETLRSA